MTVDSLGSELFDAYYFAHGCGRPYKRDAEWLEFFGSIADRIVSDIGPRTVLDAGCAMGFLVEALRERGIAAFGMDLSEYAIQQCHPDIREYCSIGSVTESLPQSYDLIVCIEVLEHLLPEDAHRAVANLCRHTHDILFSSTPFDYKEATHFNVQPPEYWAEAFARHGFLRAIDYDASFISPWAARFERRTEPLTRLVRRYEQRFWQLWKENTDLRSLTLEMRGQLAAHEDTIADLSARVVDSDIRAQEFDAHLQGLLTSRSWWFLTKMQRIRSLLIPVGSFRDRIFMSLVRMLGVAKGVPTSLGRRASGRGAEADLEGSLFVSAGRKTATATPPAPGRRNLRVALYSLDPLSAACPHLRLAGPAQHPNSGIELIDAANWQGGSLEVILPDETDVVVLQRDFPRYEHQYREVLEWAKSRGKPIVYELDDLLLELPQEHPEKEYYDEARPLMLEAIAEADAVVVSTQGIAQYLSRFNSNPWVLPNYLDDRIWALRDAPTAQSLRVVVGYMGGTTQTHLPDIETVTPVLTRLLKRYGDKLRLRFWGTFPPALADSPNVEFRQGAFPRYSDFASYFSSEQCDVFIAPLRDSLFNRSKSWIKFLEYSSLATPGVYSLLAPYQDVVVNGKNGFLASSQDEWDGYLSELIENPDLRLSIGKAAQETVRRGMLLSQHAQEWSAVYRAILSLPRHKKTFVARAVIDRQLRRWELDQREDAEGSEFSAGRTEGQERPALPMKISGSVSEFRLLVTRGLLVLRREGPISFARAVLRRLLTMRGLQAIAPVRNMLALRQHPLQDARLSLQAQISLIGHIPAVSIIIPVLNGLEYVRECLESLYVSPVSVPFEVIVIDQRSRDGTLEFLRGLSTRHRNFRLIENESNLGFGHAINQGAAISKGEFLAIANSDVIVTPTWLDRLIAPLREDPSLGIVSPVTNYVGEGPQIEREAQDVTPETASAYAVRISDRPGIVPVVDRLVFFCVILRKKVFDYLGGLASVFGLGNYEDEDFCLRARMAGFSLAIVPSAFVFHHGSRTFNDQGIDHVRLMLRNEKVFFDRVYSFSAQLPFVTHRSERQDPPLVSVIVRTKDRPHLVQQALASLANQTFKGFEAVVVNDGGVDVSSVLSQFSPHVELNYVDQEESHGRAAALNAGLARARGRWITYLDDDDVIYPTHLEHLFHTLGKNENLKVAYSDVNKALCWSGLGADLVLQRDHFARRDYDAKSLLVENWIPIMSLMHDVECIQEVGDFAEGLQIFEDWDLLIRLSRVYEFKRIPRITGEYRFWCGESGEDSTLRSRKKALETMLLIHERYPVDEKRLLDQRAIAVRATRLMMEEIYAIESSAKAEYAKQLLTTARLGGFLLPDQLDILAGPESVVDQI